jgi:hypothetical protein
VSAAARSSGNASSRVTVLVVRLKVDRGAPMSPPGGLSRFTPPTVTHSISGHDRDA